MKAIRNFGIFVLCPILLIGIGFLSGAAFMKYFYPGELLEIEKPQDAEKLHTDWQRVSGQIPGKASSAEDPSTEESLPEDPDDTEAAELHSTDSAQTAWVSQKLNADTQYVLEETDLRNNTVVETTWKLPAKYIGMNREEFLEAMESYEASPPLEELERGFVSLEVLSFSTQRVVVQMNYEYVQPGSSFYLKVENNYIVVYLEDQETVYMDTDILLTNLPQEIQQDIIHVMFIPDEESLYDFLENYSS